MGNTAAISFYKKVNHINSDSSIPFDIFLERIREGYWKDIVLQVRAAEGEIKENLKKSAPSVTLSGKFKERTDTGIEKHSGRIGIDIDNVEDPEAVKKILAGDRFVEACFTTIGGRGVCAIFRVNPEKHKEAFQGIGEYLYNTYRIISDPTSVNPSRARFISYDSNIYINYDVVPKFTSYPKNKPPKKIEKVIYAKNDFEELIAQVQQRSLNLCENYYEWLRIAFALSNQFGEEGRRYFHLFSQYSSKYEPRIADRQYNACLKQTGKNVTTISTLYYYCKAAGLEIYSERTKKVGYVASQGAKSGLNAKQIAENLQKFEGITGAEDIINQVINNKIEINEDTLVEQLEIFIRYNYNLRRNAITRFIDNDEIRIEKKDFNSIYIKAKKVFPNVSYDLIERLIISDFTPTYDPFLEFFEQHKDTKPTGCIDKVLASIKNADPAYLNYFGKKWIVALAAAAHGFHSPLTLVLTGQKQGTGKTQWFRRLLPPELKKYYAESKLDAGKDDLILMCQKLLIMDDEMGGKSKRESKFFKDLTSKEHFDLREPYGHSNVTLKRIALLGGTTNERGIIDDWSGNRRIIPVIVQGIDKALYNSVDKIELLMEAYWLYKEGFDYTVETDEDIAYLRQDESLFEIKNSESELILKYYRVPEEGEDNFIALATTTDIKVEIENLTHQRLSLNVIGQQMQRAGFEQIHVKKGKTTCRYYRIIRNDLTKGHQTDGQIDDLPF